MPYERILREYVLNPLGMSDSVFTAGEAILRGVAMGHYPVSDCPVVATPWEVPRCTRPGAGVITSLADMMKYLRFLLSPGQAAVFNGGEDMLRMMAVKHCQASGKADAMGLAWMLRYVGDVSVLRHEGASMGQYSEIAFVPERNFGLILLTNGGKDGFIERAADVLMNRYVSFGLDRRFPDEKAVPLAGMNEYVGRSPVWRTTSTSSGSKRD